MWIIFILTTRLQTFSFSNLIPWSCFSLFWHPRCLNSDHLNYISWFPSNLPHQWVPFSPYLFIFGSNIVQNKRCWEKICWDRIWPRMSSLVSIFKLCPSFGPLISCLEHCHSFSSVFLCVLHKHMASRLIFLQHRLGHVSLHVAS